MKKKFLLLILTLTTFLLIITPYKVLAQDAESIVALMKGINPGLNDYHAKLDITMKINLMMGVPVNTTGDYYYKKPDKNKLVLHKLPNVLKKYKQVFGWNLPQTSLYKTKVTSENYKGMPCYVITMIPKQGMGDLIKQQIWVDKSNYSMPKQVYYYDKNGKIEILINYRTEKGFLFFDKMSATMTFPKMKLNATVVSKYHSYEINTNLPDSIFDDAE